MNVIYIYHLTYQIIIIRYFNNFIYQLNLFILNLGKKIFYSLYLYVFKEYFIVMLIIY
jgi:hypothetical protein